MHRLNHLHKGKKIAKEKEKKGSSSVGACTEKEHASNMKSLQE